LRERIQKAEVIEDLLEMVENYLRHQGLEDLSDQGIAARLVPVPKLRKSHEENAEINTGKWP
jgi:hypothetical protein